MRGFLWAGLLVCCAGAVADRIPILDDIAAQPAVSLSQRLVEALDYLGSPLHTEDVTKLKALADAAPSEETAKAIQAIFDPYCIAFVNVNPESRVKVRRGPAEPLLQQNGWRTYLVKVQNQAGTRAELECTSPNAEPALHAATGAPNPDPKNEITAGQLAQRFLEIAHYIAPPMERALSGFELEYRIVQFYTGETGEREVGLGFNVGQGTEDLGRRNSIHVKFETVPSVKVVLRVRDDDGPTMGSFIIRDNIDRFTDQSDVNVLPEDYRNAKASVVPWQRQGLPAKALAGIYPLPSRRVADRDEYPDFFFQPQIYRADKEHVYLPPGKYDVTYTRGPEYLSNTRTIEVEAGKKKQVEKFELKRWTHLADRGWYSLDHHVHAGGCSHYESPQAGVRPEAMMRQALGEDLNVASVLSWGPCWYHQKSFFDGEVSALSEKTNLMRYDVEVSGFPSSHCGHVVLLRLNEDDYPGTKRIGEWPSWTHPVLKWAQSQGGVVGYAHSGLGLETDEPTPTLPNYVMAKFNSIGANEFIVTATLGSCDFISAGDTPLHTEMNIWYHTLNCGLRTSISGETDFPCMFDDRVGMARSYAKLKRLNFDDFAQAIKHGQNYVSDGRAHLLDFSIEGVGMGNEKDVVLAAPAVVEIRAEAIAYLPAVQDEAGARIAASGVMGRPYWHIEKARVPGTRKVPVELLVNGYAIQYVEIEADGTPQPVHFQQKIDQSSWVALRVWSSAHTNPIYVTVAGKPIRASKRSAMWCREAVDVCWKNKAPAIRAAEQADAANGYDHARRTYDAIIAESYDDTAATMPVGTLLR